MSKRLNFNQGLVTDLGIYRKSDGIISTSIKGYGEVVCSLLNNSMLMTFDKDIEWDISTYTLPAHLYMQFKDDSSPIPLVTDEIAQVVKYINEVNSPLVGDIIYELDTMTHYRWDGNKWNPEILAHVATVHSTAIILERPSTPNYNLSTFPNNILATPPISDHTGRFIKRLQFVNGFVFMLPTIDEFHPKTKAFTPVKATSVAIVAGEPIQKYQALTVKNGEIYVCKSTNDDDVIGVAIADANIGENVQFIIFGILHDFKNFNFAPNKPLFVGQNGELTTTPRPEGEVVKRVGVAIGLKNIAIRISDDMGVQT